MQLTKWIPWKSTTKKSTMLLCNLMALPIIEELSLDVTHLSLIGKPLLIRFNTSCEHRKVNRSLLWTFIIYKIREIHEYVWNKLVVTVEPKLEFMPQGIEYYTFLGKWNDEKTKKCNTK